VLRLILILFNFVLSATREIYCGIREIYFFFLRMSKISNGVFQNPLPIFACNDAGI
jgi:hypothetical protein